MKKFLSLVLIAVLLTGSLSVSVFAAETTTIYADGAVVNYTDAATIRQNSLVIVPVRDTFEAMGAVLSWNQKDSSATIDLYGRSIQLTIGSDKATANGKEVTLPIKVYIKNGRTMAPLAAVSEALGCTVVSETSVNSYIIKAKALIGSFATGDTAIPANLLTENYIQHNLAYGTGRDAFVGSVEYLGSAPTKTTVKNIRAFVDGNNVFLHTIYNFAGSGEQVAFDVFRFEKGKIAEHWDNLAAVSLANPSGHTQTDGAMSITDLVKTETNKALCEQFIKDVLMGQNPDKLTSYFDGDEYIQHNPQIADGLSGLGEALAAMAEAGIEMKYDKIHMVMGQGNYVLAISEGSFGGVPTSYYDLWRVENGKIAEHWDVMETIMPEAEHQNSNGKF